MLGSHLPAYLTLTEARAALGWTRRRFADGVLLGDLPVLTLTSRLRRVEAWAVSPDAPTPFPGCPSRVGLPYLSKHLQVSEKSLRQLWRTGLLPLRRRGRALEITRPDLYDFVAQHTEGGWDGQRA